MGPLAGTRVIEMKGVGPGPYAGMLLADMGAEVIVVERDHRPSGIAPPSERDIHSRGKQSITLNLKHPSGVEALLRLVERAEVLFEGYRPGVAERLGFGPGVCLERNPRLVYGRVTGWGQHGPLSGAAGRDINYIALTGSLAAIGGDQPALPLNLLGDYAGGSLFLVMGILAALLEARQSGAGQVIDAAITDGTASLMSMLHNLHQLGTWTPQRQSNLLDGAAPFYDSYETLDGKFIAIGPIAPQCYSLLIERMSLDAEVFKDQFDSRRWPQLKQRLAAIFKTRTRDAWCALLEGTDTCFAPVLDFIEAPSHHHHRARDTYLPWREGFQPGPAPRFSRTACAAPAPPASEGANTREVLRDWGFNRAEITRLQRQGALSGETT